MEGNEHEAIDQNEETGDTASQLVSESGGQAATSVRRAGPLAQALGALRKGKTMTTTTETPAETQTHTVTLPAVQLANALRAVLPHASKDKTLPLLTAVRVSVEGKTLTASATDRYTVGWDRVELEEETPETFAVLIPGEEVKRLISALKGADTYMPATLTVKGDAPDRWGDVNDREVTISTYTQTWTFREQDGKFPPLDRLIPAEPASTEAIGIAPHHFEKMATRHVARDKMEKTNPLVFAFHGPNKPVKVTFADHFTALIMPTRVV